MATIAPTVGNGWGFHINVINLKSKKK